MIDFANISTWASMAGVLGALIVFFVLIRRVTQLGNINIYFKSVILTVFFVGVLGAGYYFIWSPPLSPNNLVIKFPSTGQGTTTPGTVSAIKDLYATPISGLVTTALLAFIIFVTIKIIRPDTRKIKKDLEDAKIAARNVLEDLQAEKVRLIEANAKNEALLESIGEGVVATDKEGKVIVMNKVAESLLGFQGIETIGKPFVLMSRLQDGQGNQLPDNLQPITLAFVSGKTVTTTAATTDYHFLRKDGTRFPVSITATPVILDTKPAGVIVVFHDITKEKEIDRAKTEFISIASHQLRTPVSGLSWLTEALQFTSGNLTPKQKIYVRDLAMLSKRLIELVEDLLNISRIELKTPLMTEKASVEIANFIETFIKEIKPYADSKKHNIIFNKSISEPVDLEINKKSFYNVLQNLVSNAIEYSHENTEVVINLEKKGDIIKTTIVNKGPAIPKEEQARIFERFYRAESAKKMKAEGTGLGLYIIKMIIEEMGGTVGFESGEGKDTAFWFTLPVRPIGHSHPDKSEGLPYTQNRL